jgi:hypothetical protein
LWGSQAPAIRSKPKYARLPSVGLRETPTKRTFRLFVAAAAIGLATPATVVAETCHMIIESGQFGSMRACVSSVLPSQAGNDYGPKHFAEQTGAWCEGAPGPGVGERVTLHMKPSARFRTLLITNGYAKTADTFRRNGRIKRALIETSSGIKSEVTLKDTSEPQSVVIRTTTASWVRLTIRDVYPGTSGTDTCLTGFMVNLEELNN